MNRAEKIKAVLKKHNKLPSVILPVFPREESVNEYHEKRARDLGIDGRIGPLAKKVISTFWNDSRPFEFSAQLNKNSVSPGENLEIIVRINNHTSIIVDSIRINIDQYNTSTTVSASGKKSTNTQIFKWGRLFYREGKTFPMGEGCFKGRLTYPITPETEVTESDVSACYAREYVLVVQCEIPKHQNVKIPFPIRVVMK